MDSISLLYGMFLVMELIQTIAITIIAICKVGDRIDELFDKINKQLRVYRNKT